MTKADALRYFGSEAEIARALQISRSAVSQWDFVIPRGKAAELHAITDGKLAFNQDDYSGEAGKAA